jgi:CPA1 family monovalent cation:H+ antiporter
METFGAEPLLTTFIRFLAIAVLVTYAASRFRIPYSIAMVLVGLGVSIFRVSLGQEALELSPDLILLIFLPGLLFEASYHVDLDVLRINLRPILLLAIPGVILSTMVVGFLLHLILHLPLVEALLFGIIISATDPVAVVALFKELGVDRRLGLIVEGESLFNDGVAIVGFTILSGLAAGTGQFSLASTVLDFVVTVAGGATLGLVVGFIFAELMKRTDNPVIDIALTTILAYGTYLLAKDPLQDQVSPVIAVVVAGIVVGNYGSRGRHSATSMTMIVSFWDVMVFIINSFVFLLIGLEVEPRLLLSNIGPVLLAIAAVLFARAVVVYGLRLVINLRPPRMPLAWSHVMFWGGLRGAVSIALVLSLVQPVGSRQRLIALVFGCVLFSMIVQGLTIRPLLKRLGLSRRGEKRQAFERALARMATAQASIDALRRMRHQHLLSRTLAEQLEERFREQTEEHGLRVSRMLVREPELADISLRLIQEEVGYAQKQSLLQLLRQGVLSEETYSQLVAEIDEILQRPSATDWVLSTEITQGLEDLLFEDEETEKEENLS